jgi:hypothetical protein
MVVCFVWFYLISVNYVFLLLLRSALCILFHCVVLCFLWVNVLLTPGVNPIAGNQYTVRSIGFRTNFFKQQSYSDLLANKLSTINQHQFIHRVPLVYLWQCTSYSLFCKVCFFYTSSMAEIKRVTIKFCFKAGLPAVETVVLVQKDYGNEALNRTNVFRWYPRFRDGGEGYHIVPYHNNREILPWILRQLFSLNVSIHPQKYRVS